MPQGWRGHRGRGLCLLTPVMPACTLRLDLPAMVTAPALHDSCASGHGVCSWWDRSRAMVSRQHGVGERGHTTGCATPGAITSVPAIATNMGIRIPPIQAIDGAQQTIPVPAHPRSFPHRPFWGEACYLLV